MKQLVLIMFLVSNHLIGMNVLKKCSYELLSRLRTKKKDNDQKNFFNAPWRGSYMVAATKSLEKPSANLSACKLCDKFTASRDEDNYVIERKTYNYLALARYPYHDQAHMLVMPYKHTGSLLLLDDCERKEMIAIIAHIDSVFKKNKLNTFMGFNMGRNAGAGIPGHLHGHLIGYDHKHESILHFKDKPVDLTAMYAQVKKMIENAQSIKMPQPVSDHHCPDCLNKSQTSYIIKRGLFNYVALYARPFNAGHLNVVPYMHVNTIEYMSADMQQESMALIIQSCNALTHVVKASDFNIGFHNHSPEKHFKWHIIPRNQGDVSCTEAIGHIKIISLSTEQLYHALCEQFDKHDN